MNNDGFYIMQDGQIFINLHTVIGDIEGVTQRTANLIPEERTKGAESVVNALKALELMIGITEKAKA